MKIVVLDGYTLNPGDVSWTEVEQLAEELVVYDRTPPAELFHRAMDADILIANKAVIDRALLEQLPRLKFISVMATGYNVIDTAAARENGIPVSNVPVYGTETVAQHVFAMLLSFIHRPALHNQAVQNGDWISCPDFCFWLRPVTELAGKTMGIVGLGRIGRATARLADAFGMRVVANSPSQNDPPDYEGFEWLSIEQLFSQSDVVSLHCPQTDQNIEFVNRKILEQMKPTAILINTARGGLVNEKDLADALNSSTLAGACLDVVATEPMLPGNPLQTAPNCLITPHMAWTSIEARRRLMQTTADNIAAFLAGKPINVVNP